MDFSLIPWGLQYYCGILMGLSWHHHGVLAMEKIGFLALATSAQEVGSRGLQRRDAASQSEGAGSSFRLADPCGSLWILADPCGCFVPT